MILKIHTAISFADPASDATEPVWYSFLVFPSSRKVSRLKLKTPIINGVRKVLRRTGWKVAYAQRDDGLDTNMVAWLLMAALSSANCEDIEINTSENLVMLTFLAPHNQLWEIGLTGNPNYRQGYVDEASPYTRLAREYIGKSPIRITYSGQHKQGGSKMDSKQAVATRVLNRLASIPNLHGLMADLGKRESDPVSISYSTKTSDIPQWVHLVLVPGEADPEQHTPYWELEGVAQVLQGTGWQVITEDTYSITADDVAIMMMAKLILMGCVFDDKSLTSETEEHPSALEFQTPDGSRWFMAFSKMMPTDEFDGDIQNASWTEEAKKLLASYPHIQLVASLSS